MLESLFSFQTFLREVPKGYIREYSPVHLVVLGGGAGESICGEVVSVLPQNNVPTVRPRSSVLENLTKTIQLFTVRAVKFIRLFGRTYRVRRGGGGGALDQPIYPSQTASSAAHPSHKLFLVLRRTGSLHWSYSVTVLPPTKFQLVWRHERVVVVNLKPSRVFRGQRCQHALTVYLCDSPFSLALPAASARTLHSRLAIVKNRSGFYLSCETETTATVAFAANQPRVASILPGMRNTSRSLPFVCRPNR